MRTMLRDFLRRIRKIGRRGALVARSPVHLEHAAAPPGRVQVRSLQYAVLTRASTTQQRNQSGLEKAQRADSDRRVRRYTAPAAPEAPALGGRTLVQPELSEAPESPKFFLRAQNSSRHRRGNRDIDR